MPTGVVNPLNQLKLFRNVLNWRLVPWMSKRGGMHYSAMSKPSARFEKEMVENRGLSTLVNGLMSKVKT
jgi:hypothetical protein